MTHHLNDDSKYCAVPGYTFLKPGSHRIHVMMKNLTAREVIINQGIKIATMGAANIVPHMLAPQGTTTEMTEKVDKHNPELIMKSAFVMEKLARCLRRRGNMKWLHQVTPSTWPHRE